MTPSGPTGTTSDMTDSKSSTPASHTSSESKEDSSAGCFPMRNYDMTKVSGMKETITSFEDQQEWPWPTGESSPSTSA